MHRFSFLAVLAAILPATAFSGDLVDQYRVAAQQRWSEDIEKLELLDKTEKDPENGILFIGSSSIRRWATMPQDMAPWRTIRRGYGGAKYSDLAVFVDRLVRPHECDAIAIFVGNDITGKDSDKSAKEVVDLCKHIVSTIRKSHREQPIFFIEVTPTSSRWSVWPRIEEANLLTEKYCQSESGLHYINTAKAYLGDDGKPNDSLFVSDKLHLNEEGYKLWSTIIKKRIGAVLPSPKSENASN